MIRVIYNDKPILELLDGLLDAVTDLRPFWRGFIEDVLQPGMKEVFDSSGYGTWWRKYTYPWKPLIKTGRLRKSLISQTGDSVRNLAPDRLDFGEKTGYGIYHEEGRGRVPMNSFLRLYVTGRDFEFASERYADQYIQDKIDSLS